jgi:CspA family cold shock protein
MASGMARFLNSSKSFGCLRPEDGSPDVFVDIFALERSGIDELKDGDPVPLMWRGTAVPAGSLLVTGPGGGRRPAVLANILGRTLALMAVAPRAPRAGTAAPTRGQPGAAAAIL